MATGMNRPAFVSSIFTLSSRLVASSFWTIIIFGKAVLKLRTSTDLNFPSRLLSSGLMQRQFSGASLKTNDDYSSTQQKSPKQDSIQADQKCGVMKFASAIEGGRGL